MGSRLDKDAEDDDVGDSACSIKSRECKIQYSTHGFEGGDEGYDGNNGYSHQSAIPGSRPVLQNGWPSRTLEDA